MDWIQLALENPQENWLLWALFAYALARIVWGSLGVMLSMSKNSGQDNLIQSRLMDEMAAWRTSFDRRDEEQSKINKRLLDLYETSILRIDVTTQSTHRSVDALGVSGQSIHKKLSTVESYLKRLHKVLEEKKVIP